MTGGPRPITALRGALGFLSRLPVGRDERAWEAFRAAPWTLPLAGYLLGVLAALAPAAAIALSLPSPTVAVLYLLAVVALTGINHFDGVADLGDAAVVHGDADRRLEVMGDTVTGVGGTLALGIVLAGLALAGLALGDLSAREAVGVIVAAEVAAKLAMAALLALGEPAHEGFGAAVAGDRGPASAALPLALGAPAAALTLPSLAAFAALAAGLSTALVVLWWTRRRLGGVTGDVLGGANELARVVALHAALAVAAAGVAAPVSLPEVIAWTPW